MSNMMSDIWFAWLEFWDLRTRSWQSSHPLRGSILSELGFSIVNRQDHDAFLTPYRISKWFQLVFFYLLIRYNLVQYLLGILMDLHLDCILVRYHQGSWLQSGLHQLGIIQKGPIHQLDHLQVSSYPTKVVYHRLMLIHIQYLTYRLLASRYHRLDRDETSLIELSPLA